MMKFKLTCTCGRELEHDSDTPLPEANEVTNYLYRMDVWDELGIQFHHFSGTCPVCGKHWEVEMSEELAVPAEKV